MDLWACQNGDWFCADRLSVGVDDVGFLLGATVTERFRTFRHEVFRLNEHLARMCHSLGIIGLDADRIASQVEQAVPEFVVRNRGRIADADDWSIIAFATPGEAGLPASHARMPTVCVHGYPLPFDRWARQYESGVAVVISDVRQVPESCWPPDLKCRSRMHYYLADLHAARAQPGARAILLDQDGNIGEATTANVVVYHADEGLVSPSAEHILFGVSVGVLRELARSICVPFVTRPLSADELRAADEVLLTSTSICVVPVVACDGAPIGTGRPGPMFARLLSAWNELAGIDIAAQARRFATRT
jgi:branched-subunit amino acid aminotransferase/4-amino-4-deoxychorismate lyase